MPAIALDAYMPDLLCLHARDPFHLIKSVAYTAFLSQICSIVSGSPPTLIRLRFLQALLL